MGAVAAAMKTQGMTITGSDSSVYPPMSTFLTDRGITLFDGYKPENIPATADLIVVGNAISRGNPELEEVLNRRLQYLSLPETLKQFFLRGKHNLVVTGTHGKTTTTSILTHIMRVGGLDPAYMIGGIAEDLGQGASLHDSPYVVLEGDEYDTAFFDKRSKFLHYLPELVIVNNVEFDHADIYRDLDDIKLTFTRLMNIVPENGVVLYNADDATSREIALKSRAKKNEAVGFGPNATIKIQDAAYNETGSQFTLFDTHFSIPLVGEIYVRNAAMAIAAAQHYGVALDKIAAATSSFKGVARRQRVLGTRRGVTIIEDFGHHPTAITATLEALRFMYPGSRIWAITEPRSNTMRRRVMQDALVNALALADGAIVAQVARLDQLPPEERLDTASVIAELNKRGRKAFFEPTPKEIVPRLSPLVADKDVIVVFSNGGFDGIYQKLLHEL